jgi:hypothetical protein
MKDPKPQLDAIALKAEAVREAALSLSNRIADFQNWLNTMTGRVETELIGDRLILRLKRDGKEWVLFARREDTGELKPILDCNLADKISAIKMFPDLLQAMEASQGKLVSDIEAAVSKFDQDFGELLGRKRGS